jgi:molybdenum cofactor cytidylyltransferase
MQGSSAVSGVLLAAGPSERFDDDVPKQLLQVEGEPLVRRTARRALDSRLAEVIVVVGHQAGQVSAALRGLDVQIVENLAFETGQASSVRVGLAAVDRASMASLFMPADQPNLNSKVIDDLIRLFESTGGPIVVPAFEGVRGAPVLFARSLFEELRRMVGDKGGRQLFPRHAESIVELSLADPGPLADLDTQEDRKRLGL